LIPPRTLILVIGTDSLEGVLTRGDRVVSEQTQRVDPDAMRAVWESGLATLDGPLEVLLVKLGGRAGDRVVVVGRPSAGSTVHREGEWTDRTLARANELAAAHACTGFDSDKLSTRTWSWKAAGGGDDRRVMISGSVPDSVLSMVERWVSRAGLRFEGFVPLQMWETQRAIRAAEACITGTVCCRIGPEFTVIVAQTLDKGTVVRAIDFGVQVLASVYERAALHREMESDPAGAWRLMLEHGVSWNARQAANEIVHDALPMLAPVLQRLNIELKQTIRYQVGEETMITSLLCLGIGRLVPGLGEAIADHLELTLEADRESGTEAGLRPSVARGLDAPAIRSLLANEMFVPRVVTRSRRVRRLASVAAQSGAIAALMVFGEHQLLSYQADRVRGQAAELRQSLGVYEASETQSRRLQDNRNRAIDQLVTLDRAFGHAPHWPAVLRELTEDEGLSIETARVTARNDRAIAVVGGRVPALNGDTVLRDRMNTWRESGLVLSVEPTSLARQGTGGNEELMFTLEFELQRFPVWFHRPELAGLIETGGQP
jgi:hypothetical protein